jgi:hypothetical protein
MNMTTFWDIAPCSLVEVDRRFRGAITLMEAVCTSETSINFYETTRRNILEGCHLYVFLFCLFNFFLFRVYLKSFPPISVFIEYDVLRSR